VISGFRVYGPSPDEILKNRADHREPIEGDHGLKFPPGPKGAQAAAALSDAALKPNLNTPIPLTGQPAPLPGTQCRFLADDVVPACRRAGLQLVTATTDNGPEFGRTFGEACRAAGVRHHRIPPRSPNLNAFVERFRGRSSTSTTGSPSGIATTRVWRQSTPTSRPGCGSTNFERPHRGYRTKGRTPASIFFTDQPEVLQQMGAWHDDKHAA
jgi:hypothetical protein